MAGSSACRGARRRRSGSSGGGPRAAGSAGSNGRRGSIATAPVSVRSDLSARWSTVGEPCVPLRYRRVASEVMLGGHYIMLYMFRTLGQTTCGPLSVSAVRAPPNCSFQHCRNPSSAQAARPLFGQAGCPAISAPPLQPRVAQVACLEPIAAAAAGVSSPQPCLSYQPYARPNDCLVVGPALLSRPESSGPEPNFTAPQAGLWPIAEDCGGSGAPRRIWSQTGAGHRVQSRVDYRLELGLTP